MTATTDKQRAIHEAILSVSDCAAMLAQRFVKARGFPNLADDLTAALMAHALDTCAKGGKSAYDPSRGRPTTWLYKLARTFLPREFNRTAFRVTIPTWTGTVNRRSPEIDALIALAAQAGRDVYRVDLDGSLRISGTLDQVIDDDSQAVAERMAHELIEHLTAPEAAVIRLRYGLDGRGTRTYREIGQEVGVTREGARKIEERALAKARNLFHGRMSA